MPYRQALLKAVRAMILGRTPSGYSAAAVPLGDGDPGRIRATRRWTGGRFAGTAYRIVPDGSAATERAALFAGLSGDGAAAVWIASAPDAGGALRAVVVERAGPWAMSDERGLATGKPDRDTRTARTRQRLMVVFGAALAASGILVWTIATERGRSPPTPGPGLS